jgi:hypothetical protein
MPGGGDFVRAFELEAGEANAAALRRWRWGWRPEEAAAIWWRWIQAEAMAAAISSGWCPHRAQQRVERVPARDETVFVGPCPTRALRIEVSCVRLGGERRTAPWTGGERHRR